MQYLEQLVWFFNYLASLYPSLAGEFHFLAQQVMGLIN